MSPSAQAHLPSASADRGKAHGGCRRAENGSPEQRYRTSRETCRPRSCAIGKLGRKSPRPFVHRAQCERQARFHTGLVRWVGYQAEDQQPSPRVRS